ncbi:hypothetical protein DFJ43DRAFT_1036400 [Lentinula guzmanii]|uniref:Uncharacterized protein n=1 Tax=Lentinula guzmanii TaxID=2804957 RepID=A0AA38MX28_9AGAR|nr:hypothetical protein DFJ43DRAFT_1036400 [Lentinula guzmanii]
MITGAEISIIHFVAGKIKSKLSTDELKEKTEKILGDQQLVNLLGEFYQLDAKHAKEQNEQWDQARDLIDTLKTLQKSKFVLLRFMNARTAYSLAKSFRTNVIEGTTAAKLQAYKDDLRKRSVRSMNISNVGHYGYTETAICLPKKKSTEEAGRTTDKPTKEAYSSNSHQAPARNNENVTPRYILRSSSGIAFAYPRGTPENPTISCPVGSKPTIPEGCKYGSVVYYHDALMNDAELDEVNSEDDDLVTVIEIKDRPESAQHKSQASSSHHSEGSTSCETSIVNALKPMAETAHLVQDILKFANNNDDDDDQFGADGYDFGGLYDFEVEC